MRYLETYKNGKGNLWKIKFSRKKFLENKIIKSKNKGAVTEYELFDCVKILQNSSCNPLLLGLLSDTFFNCIKPKGPLFIDHRNSAKGASTGMILSSPCGGQNIYIIQVGSFRTSKAKSVCFYLLVCWTQPVSALIAIPIIAHMYHGNSREQDHCWIYTLINTWKWASENKITITWH